MQDPIAAKNFQALKKKSYDVKFELVDTNYEPLENIGIGAYGVVCSALHVKTKERVAIKKIPSIFDQPTIAKRTYREIKILKHFKHDNIISIQEIIKPNDWETFKDIYIVLDLMESDLHRIIHSKQEITDEHVRYFLYQLLRGLKYIHSANVVHRDLKPSNLLVNENCDLKIGDFGMARGFAAQADDCNILMTQYVATRWYRAPELMVAHVTYNAAVDMWSVGCILAEMLCRRQIFPGKNYIDQLKLIIGILGTPPKAFLDKTHSELLKQYISGLAHKEPEPLKKLFPKAGEKALDLLGKMLRIDPDQRISVNNALKHPFLNKYHDPDDEPICIPLFNFDFENTEMNRNQLRQCITKEVMDYHQPKPKPSLTHFDLKPVHRSDVNKDSIPKRSESAGGATGLEAFLGQLQQKSLASQKPENSFTSVKNLFKRPQGIPVHSKTPDLLSSEASKATYDVEMMSAKLLDLTTQEDGKKIGQTVAPSLKVDSHVEQSDVEMLSAKSATRDPSLTIQKTVDKTEKPVDTKALIKAALKEAALRKQRQELDGNEKPHPITARERQRQREEKRQKKMMKAMERKKKEKNKDKSAKGLLLTDDDRNMLARWKNMQKTATDTTSNKPPSPPSQPANSNVTLDLVANQNKLKQCCPGNQIKEANPANQVNLGNRVGQPGLKLVNLGPSLGVQNISNQVCQTQPSVLGAMHNQQNAQMPQPPQVTSQVGSVVNPGTYSSCRPLCLNQDLFATALAARGAQSDVNSTTSLTASTANNGQGLVGFHHQVASTNHVQPSQDSIPNTLDKDIFSLIQQHTQNEPPVNNNSTTLDLNISDQGQDRDGKGQLCVGDDLTLMSRLPTYDEAMQARVDSDILSELDLVNNLPSTTVTAHETVSTGINVPIATTIQTDPNLALRDTLSTVGDPDFISRSTDLQPHDKTVDPALPPPDFSPEWLTDITKQMMKSNMEDPLTLAQTPKGTGGGYGVGLDLDAILREMGVDDSRSDERADSAPLSASLIADWLEVTGNMDAKDLEAMKHELAMGSPVVFSDISA